MSCVMMFVCEWRTLIIWTMRSVCVCVCVCVCQCASGVLQWPMSFKWKSVSTYNTFQYFLWNWRLHMCVSVGWCNYVMFITDNDNRDTSEHTSSEAAGHRWFIMTPDNNPKSSVLVLMDCPWITRSCCPHQRTCLQLHKYYLFFWKAVLWFTFI